MQIRIQIKAFLISHGCAQVTCQTSLTIFSDKNLLLDDHIYVKLYRVLCLKSFTSVFKQQLDSLLLIFLSSFLLIIHFQTVGSSTGSNIELFFFCCKVHIFFSFWQGGRQSCHAISFTAVDSQPERMEWLPVCPYPPNRWGDCGACS